MAKDRSSEATGDTGHCSNCDELPAVLCRPCVRQQIEEAVDSYIDDKGHGHCQGCIRAGGARKCPGVEGGERVSAEDPPEGDTTRTEMMLLALGPLEHCPGNKLVGAITSLLATVRRETRDQCRERATPEPDAWKDEDDKPLAEDPEIEAAFPTRSGEHALYAEAMRYVGARYSKGGLVALVHWLLVEKKKTAAALVASLHVTGGLIQDNRKLTAVVEAAKVLRRANDDRTPMSERPRPDIAWRNLRQALDALPSSGNSGEGGKSQ